MRIKLDENLPVSLKAVLIRLGHDTDTVEEEAMKGRPDADVWTATQNEGRFLVTQDLDFADVRRFPPGSHLGLLVVRLRNPSRRALAGYIERLFMSAAVESWTGCIVVATDAKVRIRKPVK